MNFPTSRVMIGALSTITLALTAGVVAGGSFGSAPTQAVTASSTASAPSPAQRFGGPGRGGSTPAERAYRDLLDHGRNAKVLTAAHRGQWRAAPENSIPAFQAAYDDGAEMVELDVQLTKDGVPVLMHDTSVNRTTNGTGEVSSLTLAQVKQLRLKQGLGGDQAPLTDLRVPTLEEAMLAVKKRGLVNLDKGWPFREEIWNVLEKTGTIRNGLYKSNAPVAEVQDFLVAHPGALYMHMIDASNLAAVDEFGDHQPVAYEIGFGSEQDPQARRPFLDHVASGSRVFLNAMWNGLADHLTDEASLIDPQRGWEAMLDSYRTSVVQTDDVVAFERWLETGEGDPAPRDGVRVQAEDFLPGEGVGYHDEEAANRGNLQMRPGEGVDIQDGDGAVSLGWMRGGEWLTYAVDVPRDGTYRLSLRASSPYDPAGAYTASVDGGAESGRVPVEITTSHTKFKLQPSDVRFRLTAGTHVLKISLPADASQNWNLDYLQLDRVR